MTEVQELIRTLEDSDIHLEVVEDRLRINAPRGALTPELRGVIQAHKPLLITALKRDWDDDAKKVIAALPAESLRPMLAEYFEQTVALILREINCDRQEAQRQAFGLLIFQILRQGIETQLSKEGT